MTDQKPRPEPYVFRASVSPTTLARVGAFVPAHVELPSAYQLALNSEHPARVDGMLLIDTGATKTCLAESVCKSLNLRVIDQRPGTGASGAFTSDIYAGRVMVKFENGVVGLEMGMRAIPNLAESHEGLVDSDGEPIQVIGLLGRDFLANATLTIDGRGTYEVIARLPRLS